jgi:hypothetical protein
MARQIGTVLGVAGLVAILSRVSHTDPIPAYRNGLILVIAFFAAAGVVSAALLTARTVPAPESLAPVSPAPVSPAPESIASPGGQPVTPGAPVSPAITRAAGPDTGGPFG